MSAGARARRRPALDAPPGDAARGRRGRLDYALLTCALTGHFLVGADAAELRESDRHLGREEGTVRWVRCLRCDSWLAIPRPTRPANRHPPGRDGIELPLRGRALRDRFVLRLIALDRALHFVILAGVAAGLLVFAAHQNELRSSFYRVLSDLQGPVAASTQHPHGLVGDIRRLLSEKVGTLHIVAGIAMGYAALEGAEAVGLWYGRRWAEYLTFVATTLLLPLEVYELTQRLSAFKIAAFVINVVVVIYLLLAKRLFGLRGGSEAERQQRERDGGWPAIERATPPWTAGRIA